MVAAYAWNGFTDPKHVTLNCTRVRTINGLGASMLVKLSARAKNNGQRLSAFAVSEDLRQIFRVTELDQAIQVHASETDALAAAGVSGEQSSVQAKEESGVLVNLTSWARSVSELFVPEMPKEALC